MSEKENDCENGGYKVQGKNNEPDYCVCSNLYEGNICNTTSKFSLNITRLLKMPGPISQNGNFYSNDASSPKITWFQKLLKSVKPFGHKKRLRILQLPTIIPHCVS